jgi:hypothetical protein
MNYFAAALRTLLIALLPALSAPGSILAASGPVEVRLGGTLSAGNQWGMVGIASDRATRKFRRLGGRLYVHELGWAKTSQGDQNSIARLFRQAPVWESAPPASHVHDILASWMWPHWQAPAPVTCLNGDPKAAEIGAIRAQASAMSYRVGVYGSPNYGAPALPWSDRAFDDLRAGMVAGRALCLDSPPDYYFAREQAYRDWTAEAIRWARTHNVRTVMSLFPRNADFPRQTLQMVDDLDARGARPDVYAGNVYADQAGNPYPLGDENDPSTLTHVMLQVLEHLR